VPGIEDFDLDKLCTSKFKFLVVGKTKLCRVLLHRKHKTASGVKTTTHDENVGKTLSEFKKYKDLWSFLRRMKRKNRQVKMAVLKKQK
jgi:hypothetical protein